MTSKTGMLVVNIGSPDEPTPSAVRRYLRDFLKDPRVLDINPIARWALLNLVILPTRPKKAAQAYQKIWTDEGSPLLVFGQALVDGMRTALPEVSIELAMRYGNPSIESALSTLHKQGCDRLVVFPLYPQYASSSTGSSLEKIYAEVARRWNTPWLSVVEPYYDHPVFLGAFSEIGRTELDAFKPDHIIFSYHGLPERHMRKSDESGSHCLASASCCATITKANRNCYRAQCFQTTRGLVERLGLAEGDYTICFQSRLGRTPWIQPYTDVILEKLAKEGAKRVAVFCPAFTADCLETLEEIAIRNDADFRKMGGEALHLIPSLNAHPAWIRGAVDLVREVT